MTYQHISRIAYELGRIQGLAQGSGADEIEAIADCIDTIMDILDTEFEKADNDTQHKDTRIVR